MISDGLFGKNKKSVGFDCFRYQGRGSEICKVRY